MVIRKIFAGAVLATAWCASSGAQASIRHQIDIQPQALGLALKALAQQTNIQFVYPSELVKGQTARALTGSMTPQEALDKLLATTKLKYEFVDAKTVTLAPASNHGGAAPSVNDSAEAGAAGHGIRLALADAPAQADAGAAAQGASAEEKTDAQHSSAGDGNGKSAADVVVTGSRIKRPASQVAANIVVLSAEDLRATGESTLEKALRQLPQNFLGATEVGTGVSLGGMSFNGAYNITAGSSINLRGLGSQATLILIDGRRIGKSGVYGGASDISGIPLSSVERVEIMLDGASSVYGSDAVGGVVNIILKKDYEGMEAGYQFGLPSQKGFEEHIATLSGGKSWGSGRARGSLEFYKSTNLDGLERPQRIYSNRWDFPGGVASVGIPLYYTYNGQNYTAAQLPGLGLTTTSPGVRAVNYTQLPAGQSGLTAPPLSSFQDLGRNDDIKEGMSLIPATERHTLQAGFDQDFTVGGLGFTLSGNGYYSDNDVYAGMGAFYTVFDLAANDARNPFGTAAQVYWEIPELGIQHYSTSQKVARGNLQLEARLGAGWQASMGVGRSRDTIDTINYNQAGFAGTSPLNFMASNILTANSASSLAALVTGPLATNAVNQEDTADVSFNGPLFSLPGGRVRLAVGAEYRKESLYSFSESPPTQIGGGEVNFSVPTSPYEGDVARTQRSAYAELLLPFVGAGNAMRGVKQLELTGSARHDSYNVFGGDTTWSAGVVWKPLDTVRLKVNRSTSYVVPTPRDGLAEPFYYNIGALYRQFLGLPGLPIDIVDANGQPTGQVDYLEYFVYNGNPDLQPETAANWSATVEFTPPAIPGLTLSASWHEIDYENRIIGAPQPVYLEGTDYVALYPNVSRDPVSGNLIQDLRAVNAALLKQSGIDYGMRYNLETRVGQFIATANITHTDKYLQQNIVLEPAYSRVGTVERFIYGITPRYRYSGNLGWYHNGLSVNLDGSTSSDVRSITSTNIRTDKAPFIADLVIGYDLDESPMRASVPAWLQGSAVSFKVLNLFDDYLKSYNLDRGTGQIAGYYYNANFADPRGRMFYVNLTRTF